MLMTGRENVVRYLLLCGVGALIALPLIWALGASLKPLEELYSFPPTWWAESVRWENYGDALSRLPLLRFLLNSLVISTASVVGAVLTAAMAGYALGRLEWRGRRFWLVLLLGSMVVPSQLLLVPQFVLFQSVGWVGTYKPLIVPAWLGGGAFNVLLFRQFFLGVPRGYDDVARVEGASEWAIFRRVMLPAAMPAVVTAGLLSFVVHWQAFLDPLIYLSDFRTFPASVGLRMFQAVEGSWMNLVAAASMITLVPVAVLFVVCQKMLMEGLRIR
jgi:ABC-type glycerol-3-phosphate transport system permease component